MAGEEHTAAAGIVSPFSGSDTKAQLCGLQAPRLTGLGRRLGAWNARPPFTEQR